MSEIRWCANCRADVKVTPIGTCPCCDADLRGAVAVDKEGEEIIEKHTNNKLNIPWKAVEEDDAMWVLDSEGYYVTEQLSPKEAKIMAVAPDLYEACNPDFLEWAAVDILQERGNCERVERLREMARAQREAIAKVEEWSNE